MGRILSISYDPQLLLTRQMLLQEMGHEVVSAEGFAEALEQCENIQDFDLIVLGHTVPHKDKEALIRHCKAQGSSSLLALLRPYEPPLDDGTTSVESGDPRGFIEAIQKLVPVLSIFALSSSVLVQQLSCRLG
jgi:CheY-like chemotaxis protein